MKRSLGVCALSALTLLFIAAGASSAFLVPSLDLRRDEPLADTICVGAVMNRDSGVSDSNGVVPVQITFHVDRVLKGDVPPGSNIVIRYTQHGAFLDQTLTGYDVVFLKRDGDGYLFARPRLSTMRASRQLYSPYVRSADVRANLRWEVMNSLQDPSPVTVREALKQTSLLTTEDILSRIKALALSPNPDISALALGHCSTAGDDTCVSPAIAVVVQQLEMASGSTNAAIMSLRAMLERKPVGATHFNELADALKSKSDKAREFAVRLLRFSANPAALPYLKQALADTSQMVRYNAVMGLAEITKDHQHAPAVSVYKADEDTYLQYWRDKNVQ